MSSPCWLNPRVRPEKVSHPLAVSSLAHILLSFLFPGKLLSLGSYPPVGSKLRKEVFGSNRQYERLHLGINWGRLGSGVVKEGERTIVLF